MKRVQVWLRLLFLALGVLLVIAALYYQSGEVDTEKLAALIDSADEVRVSDGVFDDGEPLFTSRERHDLDALKVALRVKVPDEYEHCLCSGTPAVCLYRDGVKVGQVTNHHVERLRCDLWWSDAPIADVDAFLAWFDERGIDGPRDELERRVRHEAEKRRLETRWLAAAPAGFFEFDEQTADECIAALRNRHTDDGELVLRLFSWFGSGAGSWTECPSYEYDARELLEMLSTDTLLAAIEGEELTPEQMEGVARLFSDWDFSGARPNDYERLSAELRARLYQHGMASLYEDNRHRARVTFGPEPEG